jgi:hypothetical protein
MTSYLPCPPEMAEFTFYSNFVGTQWAGKKMPKEDHWSGFLLTENKIGQYGVSYPRGGNQQIFTPGEITKRIARGSAVVYLLSNQGYTVAANCRCSG